MQNRLLAAIVASDGYASPILLGDGAKIVFIGVPTNTVAYIEGSGLLAGHYNRSFQPTRHG